MPPLNKAETKLDGGVGIFEQEQVAVANEISMQAAMLAGHPFSEVAMLATSCTIRSLGIRDHCTEWLSKSEKTAADSLLIDAPSSVYNLPRSGGGVEP